jgi:hypothetical protein
VGTDCEQERGVTVAGSSCEYHSLYEDLMPGSGCFQVFVPIQRRPSCGNILAEHTRPLHLKLEGFLDVVLYYMMDEWGGHDLASCTAEMVNAAQKFSGSLTL